MSWVMVSPELVVAAAADLAGIGSAISSANAAAAVNTTGLLTAGADEVSTAIAALFGAQGQAYQAASAQAAAFYAQFVQALSAGGGAYAAAEAAAVSPLLAPINHPPGPPLAPVPRAPLAPLPISGRPVAAWMGALNTSIRLCNGDAAAISATA